MTLVTRSCYGERADKFVTLMKNSRDLPYIFIIETRLAVFFMFSKTAKERDIWVDKINHTISKNNTQEKQETHDLSKFAQLMDAEFEDMKKNSEHE
jgi:hypothetical protein